MKSIYALNRDELFAQSRIPLRAIPDVDSCYREIAREMINAIRSRRGERIVFIVPVGPVGHYSHFVDTVNRERISLKNVWFFNMDEYLNNDGTMIDEENPLSFIGFMKNNVYGKIDPDLVMPESQRFFPTIGRERELTDTLEKLGGADMCIGSSGINGHIAFNEPPEPGDEISDEAFANLPTRDLFISRETLTINASRMLGGSYDLIPRRCMTIGMREILASKVIKLYYFRDWQWAILRKALLEEPTRKVPASFLQRHPGAEIIATDALLTPMDFFIP